MRAGIGHASIDCIQRHYSTLQPSSILNTEALRFRARAEVIRFTTGANMQKTFWGLGVVAALLCIGCNSSSEVGAPGAGVSGEVVRVSRQNNSGTYAYFKEVVIGKDGFFKQGSIDQSGSKDVVELVAKTPNAIGYSGMGYATDDVKMLAVSKDSEAAVPPTSENASNGSYPLARGLNIYTAGEPTGALKHYLDWIMSSEGQAIVTEIGYVPAPNGGGDPPADTPPDASIKIAGSDTMVNLAQKWAEVYMGKYPNVKLEVSGGGSGVGLAGLQKGTTQMANASRDIKQKEVDVIKEKFQKDVSHFVVALDALAVYVHPENPLKEISLADLKQIYGEGGTTDAWEQVSNWPAATAAH